MERIIDFKPGYYEWLVFLNGKCVHSFGDLSEDIAEGYTVEEIVDTSVDVWEMNLEENQVYPFTEKETEELKNMMIKELNYYYAT